MCQVCRWGLIIMAAPDPRRLDQPLGPLRNGFIQEVTTEDYIDERGFVAHALTMGMFVCVPLGSDTEISFNAVIGSYLNSCGVPIFLKAIKSTSTVTSFMIGTI